MKLFDEKGKVFGFVNIIDLLVILAILAVGFVGVYKMTGKTTVLSGGDKGEVTLNLRASGRLPFIAKGFHIGDKLVSAGDFVEDSEIVSVSTTPTVSVFTNDEGIPFKRENPLIVDVLISIKAKTKTNGPVMKVGIQEVAIGKTFTVRTATSAIDTTVEAINIKK